MAKCKWCGGKRPVNTKGICGECDKIIFADVNQHKEILLSLAKEATPFLPDNEKNKIFKQANESFDSLNKYRKAGIPFKQTDIDELKNNIIRNLGMSIDKTNDQKQEKARQSRVGCLVLIIVFAILFFSIKSCLYVDNTPVPPDDTEVYVASQLIVEDYLKSPSSAKYPLSSEATISKTNDHSYTVATYVDSQNSFGAIVRSKYVVEITYNNDWSKYSATSVIIDGERLK